MTSQQHETGQRNTFRNFIGWVFVLCGLLMGVWAIVILIWVIFVPHKPDFEVGPSDQRLEMSGVEGRKVRLGLNVGDSIKLLWASEGVDLVLLGPESGRETAVNVVPAKAKEWGDTIRVDATEGLRGAARHLQVRGDFVVPEASGAETRAFSGRLEGKITYPAPFGDGFSNYFKTFSVPVQLEIIPSEKAGSDWGRWLRPSWIRFGAVLGVALLLFLTGAVMLPEPEEPTSGGTPAPR